MPRVDNDTGSISRSIQHLTWLLLSDAGYKAILPAIVLFEVLLSAAAIHKVTFTEIDFQTYIGQADLFLDGERDYSKLNPAGGSGPCVYPAAHIYLYSAFSYLTSNGEDLLPAQACFAALMVATLVAVASLYRKAEAPPMLLIPLVLSKRMHSIFLLRMFNDPVALFFIYLSLNLACTKRWKLASILFSLGLGVKMNVLLLFPAYSVALFVHTGFAGLSSNVIVIVAVQALLALPFALHDPQAYLSSSFDLSRQFLYKWTVNWRLVPEGTFLSQPFAQSLLGVHLTLLIAFGLFSWTGIGRQGVSWITSSWKGSRGPTSTQQVQDLLTMLFTANLIGVLCSRSLHYQFYSWYFHQIPFLLWRSRLPRALAFILPIGIEWSWNVFPSTEESSLVLLASNLILLAGAGSATNHQASQEAQIRDAEIEKVSSNEGQDDLSVERMLSDGSKVQEKQTALSEVIEEADDATITQNKSTAVPSEDAMVQSFRRRIVVRRKITAGIARLVPVLRYLMVVASIVLLVVIPYPHSPLTKGVYVDENALQPGQAKVYWDYFDVTYADMLSEKVERIGNHHSPQDRADLIKSELTSYGLTAHTQNYNYTDPTGHKASGVLAGTNVYARSPSPRIDGREAIILSASWQSRWFGANDPFADDDSSADIQQSQDQSKRRVNVRGIAILLTLARYLGTQSHLSKDLIFVVGDGHLEGMQAWASSFFGDIQSNLQVDPIQDGGSQVWNALSIDYPSDSFSSLAVLYEGVDGQLPNMDSLNSLLRIAERVGGGVPISLFGEEQLLSQTPDVSRALEGLGLEGYGLNKHDIRAYGNGVRSILHQLAYGATGQPSGPHGFLQKHHVDAITIFAVPARGPYGFFHLGRIVESYVRSLSNLLERLHHSQFIYLLVSPRRFVPIGVVIFVPLLLAISMTFSGLGIWYEEEKISESRRGDWARSNGLDATTNDDDVQLEAIPIGKQRQLVVRRWLAEKSNALESVANLDSLASSLLSCSRPYQRAAIAIVVALFSGLLQLSYFSRVFSPESPWATEMSKLAMLIAAVAALAPIAFSILLRAKPPTLTRRVSRLIHAFSLLQAGMIVAVMSTLNFAFATALGFASMAVIGLGASRSEKSSLDVLSALVRYLLLAVLSPSAVYFLSQHPSSSLDSMRKLLFDAFYNWTVLGTNTIPLVCLLYYPIVFQMQMGLALYLS